MATTFTDFKTDIRSFESLGSFLVAVYREGLGLEVDPRLENLRAAAGADEAHGDSIQFGGAAVPIELIPRVLRIAQDAGVLGLCTHIPLRSSRATIPARVDRNHSSSVTGGVTISRRPQTLEITASRGTLEQIRLNAVSVSGLVHVSEELMADSPEVLAVYLETAFEDALTAKLMDELIRGTGVGEFLGLLNSPALIAVSTSGQSPIITGANVQAMALQCWNYDSAVWLANPDARGQLFGAYIAGATGDRFVYETPRSEGELPRLLGRPIYFVEQCSTLATVGDLICFNPSEYLIGDRSRDLSDSMHVRFENNERAIRFSVRNDGQPWWRSTLTPENGANELSPYVALQTRT